MSTNDSNAFGESENLPFLILNLGLDIVDGVGGLHLKGDGLASESLNKDLHAMLRRQIEVLRSLCSETSLTS
jgi:hypothetical protein